jgi:hypothetical protein
MASGTEAAPSRRFLSQPHPLYSMTPLQSVQSQSPSASTNASAECSTTGRLGRGSISFFGAGGTQAPTFSGPGRLRDALGKR